MLPLVAMRGEPCKSSPMAWRRARMLLTFMPLAARCVCGANSNCQALAPDAMAALRSSCSWGFKVTLGRVFCDAGGSPGIELGRGSLASVGVWEKAIFSWLRAGSMSGGMLLRRRLAMTCSRVFVEVIKASVEWGLRLTLLSRTRRRQVSIS